MNLKSLSRHFIAKFQSDFNFCISYIKNLGDASVSKIDPIDSILQMFVWWSQQSMENFFVKAFYLVY